MAKGEVKPEIKKGEIRIENVVASSTLGVDIDLEKVAVSLKNIEYEPEQFPGLVFHLDRPKTAALIFGSGKIVCTGAKSIEMVHTAIEATVQKIRETGIEIPPNPPVTVQNIVASGNLHAELNLDAIAVALERTEYEPEQFPGLVYRMTDPKVVVLLFGSGKMVCTGAKTPADAKLAVDRVGKKLSGLGLL